MKTVVRGELARSPGVFDTHALQHLQVTAGSIELDQPASVNDEGARARIAATQPDAVILCAFGALVKEPLLSDYDILNVHPSLLPRWRGAAPVERAVMAGDTETGVAVIELVAALDAGPIHGLERFAIGPEDDAGTVAERALDLGVPLLAEALRGATTGREQVGEATYAARIGPDDRRIDWSGTAASAANGTLC